MFLNGAILGMRRAEIRERFDEIVEFAELQQFLDTPVKRYSSGMYVRLAFAVAAYLEPEILFVDEVLSVGDQAFQQRCIGRMGEIALYGGSYDCVFFSSATTSRRYPLYASAVSCSSRGKSCGTEPSTRWWITTSHRFSRARRSHARRPAGSRG